MTEDIPDAAMFQFMPGGIKLSVMPMFYMLKLYFESRR